MTGASDREPLSPERLAERLREMGKGSFGPDVFDVLKASADALDNQAAEAERQRPIVEAARRRREARIARDVARKAWDRGECDLFDLQRSALDLTAANVALDDAVAGLTEQQEPTEVLVARRPRPTVKDLNRATLEQQEPARPTWIRLTWDTIGLEKGTIHRVVRWDDEGRPLIAAPPDGDLFWPRSWAPAEQQEPDR